MKGLLVLLCIAELLLITFLQNVAGPFVSPALLLAVSLTIAFVYWRLSRGTTGKVISPLPRMASRGVRIAQVAAFVAISIYLFYSLSQVWQINGIGADNATSSDIIPQIMYLTRRLRAGQMPYAPIHFGYDLYPTYLPLQWMPYWLAESGGFDYRWIASGALWLVCLYYFISSVKPRQPAPAGILPNLMPLWPLAAWTLIVASNSYVFAVSVEGLVAAYYLFTALRAGDNKVLPFAIGISFCLLSRYSIVMWAPLCLFIYYASGQKRQAFTILGIVLACFLVFYWYPFLRHDSQIFLNGYRYHSKAAADIWNGNAPCISNGLAFDTWFMQFASGDRVQRLHANQLTHAALCGLAIVVMGVYYRVNRARLQLKSYLLFSLKVYITLFYSFIQIPFSYLYLVPVMISAALLKDGILRPAATPSAK